jgi:hypothetical protein
LTAQIRKRPNECYPTSYSKNIATTTRLCLDDIVYFHIITDAIRL